jgi:GT2 family glycosyltransferase
VLLGENYGFARACNEGSRFARGEYVVLLNNDTLPTPGWLEKLLECAKNEPNAGVIGSKLLFPDGRLQHIGVAFDEFRNPRHIYRGLTAGIAPAQRNREYQAVTGACMLVPRNIYSNVGGMDERYMNSCEDVDFCMKVRQAGYRVLFCADSVVYHFESLSQGRHDNDLRNLALFKARWGSVIHNDADAWCEHDGIRDELTQFEPHHGYDSNQGKKIDEVWKKIFGVNFPKADEPSYVEVRKSAASGVGSSTGGRG